ncbi:MAG: heme biosynthesis protein HemY [Hyphomicrobiales bacterium]|nr:heme biosynthesis protein HemY [Hyphomicrobiales bacterium]MCP5370411.1 heme biosynthesis protein HemY [Hyphomicrobiales bacterium]
MIRALILLLIFIAAAVGAVLLADNPGAVVLDWGGYHIETSAAVLAGVAILAAVVLTVVLWGLVALFRAPKRLARAGRERSRRKGYEALTRGMVAVAAGDTSGARKQVRKAEVLLQERSLTLLLSAQAAQLAGDEDEAARHFTAMLDTPDTEFLGVRGLLSQAIKAGDWDRALELAERARRLRPDSDWVNTSLFDLQVRAAQWGAAEETVAGAVKHGLLEGPDSLRRQAILNHELSLEAGGQGQVAEAIRRARKASEQAPDLVPAVVRHARLLVDEGKLRKATTVLEEAWARRPHVAFLDVYWDARDAKDALQKVRAAQRLAKTNADHPESHLAVARTALDAQLWGEARKHLAPLVTPSATDEPAARVCRMMAELEEAEHGNTELARAWLMRASMAEPDPAWICDSCGAVVAEWTPSCGKCRDFDSLTWRAPPVVRPLGAADLPRAALAAPGKPDGASDQAADSEAPPVIEHGEDAAEGPLTADTRPAKEGASA